MFPVSLSCSSPTVCLISNPSHTNSPACTTSGAIDNPQLYGPTAEFSPSVRCSLVYRQQLNISSALSFSLKKADSKRRLQCRAKTYTVEIFHEGVKHVLQVPEDETILSVAVDKQMNVPYDCKLGVCMTCPAKLEKGTVDQSGGMLSEDVIERGYALMCVAYPLSDCTIRTIPEDELLSLQLATAGDS